MNNTCRPVYLLTAGLFAGLIIANISDFHRARMDAQKDPFVTSGRWPDVEKNDKYGMFIRLGRLIPNTSYNLPFELETLSDGAEFSNPKREFREHLFGLALAREVRFETNGLSGLNTTETAKHVYSGVCKPWGFYSIELGSTRPESMTIWISSNKVRLVDQSLVRKEP